MPRPVTSCNSPPRFRDQMWRATINYGRKGLPIQAISAVDIALWDVLGKLKIFG